MSLMTAFTMISTAGRLQCQSEIGLTFFLFRYGAVVDLQKRKRKVRIATG